MSDNSDTPQSLGDNHEEECENRNEPDGKVRAKRAIIFTPSNRDLDPNGKPVEIFN